MAFCRCSFVASKTSNFSFHFAKKKNHRTLNPDHFKPEVIQYENWVQLKPEPKGAFSGWIKGAFRAAKKDIQESTHQQLQTILSTAPMWDRYVSESLMLPVWIYCPFLEI